MGADEAVVRVTRSEHLAPGRTVGAYAQHRRLLISTHGAAVPDPTGSAPELATYSGVIPVEKRVETEVFGRY